jgi:Nucleotidyl transferase AbiEii toxin, Type IV TA system
MDPEQPEGLSRPPDADDLVRLARELNRLGVRYVVIGGFAINRLGYNRATEDIDLLIARDLANQRLVKQALEILPNRFIRELGDEDIAQWVVVRISDDILVDLMTEACGVGFEEALPDIETEIIQDEPIPFASPELMLKLKRGFREKDQLDRSFIQHVIAERKKRQSP